MSDSVFGIICIVDSKSYFVGAVSAASRARAVWENILLPQRFRIKLRSAHWLHYGC